jgi:alkyl hydroperoxide reductase subunit AhpC
MTNQRGATRPDRAGHRRSEIGRQAEALGLSFPLLSDDAPWGATAAAYRVHPDAQDRRRAVFVIDHEGVVRWAGVYPDAINPGVDGVLSALEGMRAAAA